MAKPNQPKEVKPKTDEAAKKGPIDGNMKMIVINLATTVLICVLFISVNYVLQSSLLSKKLGQNAAATAANTTEDDSSGDGSADEIQKGLILDLGDFILNLSDTNQRKYLKADVAIEVSKTASDSDATADASSSKESKGGSKGGSSASSGGDSSGGDSSGSVPAEMEQYKPAIRDAIITTLSSKTAAELSTVAGKELAKEQITDAVNGIFSGERQVIRVSFGQFIIQ